jgi:hypothetical protein
MRNPAAKGKDDQNQRAIREAIEALGFPVMDLSGVGGGCEDLLVGLQRRLVNGHLQHYWLPVEVKVPPVRYTKAQLKWRARTPGYPRITATSAQDAVDQLRRMTG